MDVLNGSDGGRFSYEQLGQMKYVEMFLMEVLRLHPSVPKEGKTCFKSELLPDGTPVKRGDVVGFNAWAMGRDEDLWADPYNFDPMRFFEKPKPSPFVFTAFQAGPRICLGQNFAIVEMKCFIARLLQHYEFSLRQDPATVTYENSLTLPIKGGLLLAASKITHPV